MAYPVRSLQHQPTIGLYQVFFLITLSLCCARFCHGEGAFRITSLA